MYLPERKDAGLDTKKLQDQLDTMITNLPVRLADDPLLSVVQGAGKVLEELDFFKEDLMR